MSATTVPTQLVSNTPFVFKAFASCPQSNPPNANCRVAPFDMYGYQISSSGTCGTVNQWTYQPDVPLFFSADQCADNAKNGLGETTYRPKAVFDY